ncbi:MAG: efflux RND transporter periplasmic adaptor subunit [Hyphomicrobiales bacterium]|nr:MAG: efflux RND transporter periplasmic adaptor subunit [Hyphomicrobiales bacterium]
MNNVLGAVRRRSVWLVLGTIFLVAMVVAAWMSFRTSEPPQYLTTKPKVANIDETVAATGTIRPSNQVAVGAQVSGQLKSLKVGLGDRVEKGKLLAIVDPELQKNELRRTKAVLADARAARAGKIVMLRQYKAEELRQRQMLETKSTSQADYDAALANVDSTIESIASASAMVTQAEVGVATARANLGYTKIVAPIDGEVIAVVTKEGQTLVSSQIAPVILILADLDVMTVRAKVSEADVVRTKAGLPVYFTILGAPDRRFESRLKAVEPAPESIVGEVTSQQYMQQTSQNTGAVYYNALFDVANPERVLKASMTAQVSILLGSAKQALTVPVAALNRRNVDQQYEVRVLQDGKVQTRNVTVGLINDTSVQVLAGLGSNDDVVIGDSLAAASAAAIAAAAGKDR